MAQAAPATEPTTDDRRLPPHDLDAEMSVLGAMMMQAKIIPAVQAILQPGDFYRESHGLIYRTILDLIRGGRAVDLVLVADLLDERGQLQDAGGKGQLAQIAAYPTATSNAPHHAQIVHEHAVLRALIAAGQEIVRLGHERGAPVGELVDRARKLLDEVAA